MARDSPIPSQPKVSGGKCHEGTKMQEQKNSIRDTRKQVRHEPKLDSQFVCCCITMGSALLPIPSVLTCMYVYVWLVNWVWLPVFCYEYHISNSVSLGTLCSRILIRVRPFPYCIALCSIWIAPLWQFYLLSVPLHFIVPKGLLSPDPLQGAILTNHSGRKTYRRETLQEVLQERDTNSSPYVHTSRRINYDKLAKVKVPSNYSNYTKAIQIGFNSY